MTTVGADAGHLHAMRRRGPEAVSTTSRTRYARTESERVRFIRWMLVAAAAFDGVGFTFGPGRWVSGPTYVVLRQIPGGMRTAGALLLILAMLGGAGLRRCPRLWWHVVPIYGVGFYLFWLLGIVLAWPVYGIPAWGAPTKSAVFAGIYWLASTAPRHLDRR